MSVVREEVFLLIAIAACGSTDVHAPASPPPALRVVDCIPAPLPPRIPPSDGDDEDAGVGGFGTLTGVGLDVAKRPPVVAIGPAIETGYVGALPIRAALRTRVRAIRDCYLAAPTLRGTVLATFAVGRGGRVTDVHVRGDAGAVLEGCVARALADLAVDGAVATIARATYPFVFAPNPDGPSSLVEEDRAVVPWTPFATTADPSEGTARAAKPALIAVRARAGELAACVPPDAPTGSLRAMLEIVDRGAVASARVGGLGIPAIEGCVRDVLGDLALAVPPNSFAEVACDLAYGEARAWHVAAAGYTRIDVGADGVRVGGELVDRHAEEPPALPAGATYLVVVAPGATGELIEHALVLARAGDATLVAVPDGATFAIVGAGRNDATVTTGFEKPVHPSLVVGETHALACAGTSETTAPLADPRALARLVADLAVRCRERDCAETLGIAVQPQATMRDVAAVADAARRAGFVRVAIGAFATCHP